MTLRWVVAVRVLLPSSLFSICSVVVKVGSETVWLIPSKTTASGALFAGALFDGLLCLLEVAEGLGRGYDAPPSFQ